MSYSPVEWAILVALISPAEASIPRVSEKLLYFEIFVFEIFVDCSYEIL